MPTNRNTFSIVDHMFFFQIRTSFSQVPDGSSLACLLKWWKDIILTTFAKRL
jgi:hypothetical protein